MTVLHRCETLNNMVAALHEIGNVCFPEILSVILSTEVVSGLESISVKTHKMLMVILGTKIYLVNLVVHWCEISKILSHALSESTFAVTMGRLHE
jgi:hypothetical protein